MNLEGGCNDPAHLRQFSREEQNETSLLVPILKDFSVALTEWNWDLHSQDLVYLDMKLATILVEGHRKETEVS